jgi:hypothetical protein
VDLWEQKITVVDLYLRSLEQGNQVETSSLDISVITGEMVKMLPSMGGAIGFQRCKFPFSFLFERKTLLLHRNIAVPES